MNTSYETHLQAENAELRNAKIIQQGLLPKERHFNRLFENYFVVYLPKKIISGDFYWVGENGGLRYIVAGDCTGHGVSAALLSVLAINLFEYAIMNKRIKKTSKILKEIDKRFIESFKGDQETVFDNPWIDLSLICLDTENKRIYFSGANRKIVHISKDNELKIYSGNRYPIGGWQLEGNREFSPQTFTYSEGDSLYLGSDGFQDQIGGKLNKKYKSTRLHDFLLSIHNQPMREQKERLLSEHYSWKRDNEQIDDICLIGLKLD